MNLDESIGTEDFQSVDTTEIPEEPVTIIEEIIINETTTTEATDYEYSDDMFNSNTTTEDYQKVVANAKESTEILEENPTEALESSETEKRPATFPVTELLNGIYKLIQGYIPTQAEKQAYNKPIINHNYVIVQFCRSYCRGASQGSF